MTRLPGLTVEQVEALSARNRAARERIASNAQTWHGPVAKPTAATRKSTPGKPAGVKKALGDPHSRILASQILSAGLPVPILEYRFAPPRRWRADLAYPGLLIEIDGMVHRIKARFKADLERDQAIFFLGWRKLRVSPAQVRSGEALELVRRALA